MRMQFSYCFYADLTIYEFCNTKRRITVTTIVEGLKNKVLRQWKGLQTRFSNILLDKDLMLPFVSIKSLQFRTWNCVSIISYASAYAAKHFYLLDKEFMLPFGSIRSLRFRSWNCINVISYASAYAAKHFLLLDKEFMLPFGSIRSS